MYCTLYFRNPGTRTCLTRDIPLQATFSSMYFVFGTGFSSGPGLNRYVRRVEGKVLTSQILLQLRLHSTQSSPTLASVTLDLSFCQIGLISDTACSSEPVLSFPFLASDPRQIIESTREMGTKWALLCLCLVIGQVLTS